MEIYVAVILCFIFFSYVILRCKLFSFSEKLTRKYFVAINSFIPEDDGYSKKQKLVIAKSASFITAVVVLIFLITIILSGVVPYITGAEENKLFGPVGDLFNGVVTPFLTFFTFCGLLITILIQNVQMRATLKELRLTQREAKKI